MIKTLHISNYALIDEIDIDFAPGFNIITGETGAGKSIILGALALLLGGRADMRAIRRGERKSVIEAVFSVSDAAGIEEILDYHGLDAPIEGECILRRELSPGGRSRAFVNDSPVTLQQLRDVAMRLVDIHSQHQNLLLADPEYQLDILDSMAGTHELLDRYRRAYAAFRVSLKQYTDTRDLIRRNRDDAEYISYQYQELAEMNLQPGEHESLEQERDILANVGDIKENLSLALAPLVTGSSNAVDILREAVDAVQRLADTLGDAADDIDFHALGERLESVRIEVADIADTLADADKNLMADPRRLMEVEERLGELYSLEMKHHVENADELIALRDRLQAQMEALDDGENIMAALATAAKRAKGVALTLAQELSDRRTAAATDFAAELRRRAAPLGMPNLRCEISITRGKLGPAGMDQVQFLLGFNKNQALMPVGSTASGGEISRLMLTIKSMVAERMKLPSIIFDEVDTGVSGDIAGRMAAMMLAISRHIQVITITHLPGVAAMGRRHFKVYKEDSETDTNTRIRTLSEHERVAELALMISGSETDEAALANARALLAKGTRDN
ncbi:MAG: DNA repair protein RecN [Muribaculaceae bacterium]|nr:DNA repair protein RecN [Muribaculaceae bacterium]